MKPIELHNHEKATEHNDGGATRRTLKVEKTGVYTEAKVGAGIVADSPEAQKKFAADLQEMLRAAFPPGPPKPWKERAKSQLERLRRNAPQNVQEAAQKAIDALPGFDDGPEGKAAFQAIRDLEMTIARQADADALQGYKTNPKRAAKKAAEARAEAAAWNPLKDAMLEAWGHWRPNHRGQSKAEFKLWIQHRQERYGITITDAKNDDDATFQLNAKDLADADGRTVKTLDKPVKWATIRKNWLRD